MDRDTKITELRAAIECACRAHDDAGRVGEDQLPYKRRIRDLRFDLDVYEAGGVWR